jgi:general secretion pathway protein N
VILRARRPAWAASLQASGRGRSTDAELAWGKSRRAALRWALGGGVLGALIGLLAFAPAAWLARALAATTEERLLLADARGSVWSGSALAVLTGGPQSRDASALPGRLHWTLSPTLRGLELQLRQACCLNGTVALQLRPAIGGLTAQLVGQPDWIGQWPGAWLSGLGTPFNTLRLGGVLRLASPGVTLRSVQGRWQVEGQAELELLGASSRLAPLDNLGSYRLGLRADPANAGHSLLTLATEQGPLQLSGNGSWGPEGVRFRGEARAASDETVLSNLLNIIGRREGARSVISIG